MIVTHQLGLDLLDSVGEASDKFSICLKNLPKIIVQQLFYYSE